MDIVKIRFLPAPRIGVAIDPVARTHDHELVDRPGRHGRRRIGFVLQHSPGAIGVHRLFAQRVALHDQSRPQAHLGPRFLQAEIPDNRSHHILPRLEVGRYIDRLEAPVEQIATGRPEANRRAVHEETVAVVGREMDDKRGGGGFQVEGLAKMENPVVVRRGRRMGDPRRRPAFLQQVGIDRQVRVGCEERVHGGEKKDKGKKASHEPRA